LDWHVLDFSYQFFMSLMFPTIFALACGTGSELQTGFFLIVMAIIGVRCSRR